MTQCKKKVGDEDDHIDRISDMPRDVVVKILESLPIRDIIKTSILSTKWRYKWTSVPQLKFTNISFQKCESFEIPNVITRVLLLHHSSIQKFTLHIPRNSPIRTKCLNNWILDLSRKGIQFLNLVNLQCFPLQAPSHIFSCEGLTYLDLHNFMLSTVPDFGAFKSLVTLYLSDIRFEPNVFESLMLACPSLVTLDISHCWGLKCINVSSPVLEILNLQSDQATESICLENAKNLTDLVLLADRPGDNFERDTMSNLIKGLSKIKSICLGEGYFKIFSTGLPKGLQGSLNCLKYVELYGVDFTETRELLFVISLLKSSPNIEKLLIESHSNNLDLGLQHTLDESMYNRCSFTQLLTVNIIVKNACNSTLNFIRFLLANSSSLEILSFNVDLGKGHYLIPHISRDLQQMERASQRAEVEFIYDDMID